MAAREGRDAEAGLDEEEERELTAKEKLYLLLERPDSSRPALYVMILILTCIVASTITFCLETMPRLEKYEWLWWDLEVFFVTVFTVEYAARFYATPKPKMNFILEPLNIIDVLAILPFYLEVFFKNDTLDLRILRVLRIFRMFKAGKYSDGCQLIFAALSGSKEALVLLVLFMGIASIIFAAVMMSLERGDWNAQMGCYVRPGESQCSPFQSIPEGCYWAVTTITTVGYGDVLPTSDFSKAVCGICMVCGVLVLALPVTMIGVTFSDSFTKCQEEAKIRSAIGELKNAHQVSARIEKLLENLATMKEHCKESTNEIAYQLKTSIEQAEERSTLSVQSEVVLAQLATQYNVLSKSALGSIDDLESHLKSFLTDEEQSRRVRTSERMGGLRGLARAATRGFGGAGTQQ